MCVPHVWDTSSFNSKSSLVLIYVFGFNSNLFFLCIILPVVFISFLCLVWCFFFQFFNFLCHLWIDTLANLNSKCHSLSLQPTPSPDRSVLPAPIISLPTPEYHWVQCRGWVELISPTPRVAVAKEGFIQWEKHISAPHFSEAATPGGSCPPAHSEHLLGPRATILLPKLYQKHLFLNFLCINIFMWFLEGMRFPLLPKMENLPLPQPRCCSRLGTRSSRGDRGPGESH